MTANVYYSPRSDRKVRRRLLIVTVLVVVLVIADFATGGAIRLQVRSTIASFLGKGTAIESTAATSGYFETKRSLENSVLSLESQLNQYKEKAALYQVEKNQNEQLRDLVHLASAAPGITAPVISSFKSSPYGTFIVGAGKNDGVAAGNIVMTPGGFAIGKVTDVSDKSALVTEFFASGQSIEATIAGSATLVEGRGNANGHAKIPHGIDVAIGDPVTSQILGGKPIGIVGEVESSQASAYTDVYIGLPINLSAIEYVFVEK